MTRLTLTAVRRELKLFGWTIRRQPAGDYRVNTKHGDEATAYYTEDLVDALATARAEARYVAEREREREQLLQRTTREKLVAYATDILRPDPFHIPDANVVALLRYAAGDYVLARETPEAHLRTIVAEARTQLGFIEDPSW